MGIIIYFLQFEEAYIEKFGDRFISFVILAIRYCIIALYHPYVAMLN